MTNRIPKSQRGYMETPSTEAYKAYYNGFKPAESSPNIKFTHELEDLERMYVDRLAFLQRKVECCLPSLLHCMEDFLKLHKENEEIREKLDILLAKTGREPQEESTGGCNE